MFNRSTTSPLLYVCSVTLAFVGVLYLCMAIYESLFGHDIRVVGTIYKVCMGLIVLGSSMLYNRSRNWGLLMHGIVFIMSLPFLTVFPEIKYDIGYLVYFATPIILLLAGFVVVFSKSQD